jgi:hypothetical protein
MAPRSGLELELQLDVEKEQTMAVQLEQTMAVQLGHSLDHGWEPKMGPSMEAKLE